MSEFKFDKAIFQANLADDVHGSVLPLKIGCEMPVLPGSDVKKAWDLAYNEAKEWASEKKLIIAGHSLTIDKKSPSNAVASMIVDIYSCEDLETLETYRKLAASRPDLQAAFDQTFEKLLK